MGHERSMRAQRVTEEAHEQLLRMGCIAGICLLNYTGYAMIAASTSEETQARVNSRSEKMDIITGPDTIKKTESLVTD